MNDNADIPLEDKIAFLESAIEVQRANGFLETVRYLKAICKDLRARLAPVTHATHKALSHQVQAAKRQRARLGYIEPGIERGLAHAMIAHWPAIEQALRDAARNEELRREATLYRQMVAQLPTAVEERP